MKESINKIKETLQIIDKLRAKFKLKSSSCDDPFIYSGVAQSDIIDDIIPEVEFFFGEPYKKRGESVFLKNWFDSFVKRVGGIRKEQILYRKIIDDGFELYCAFWPWGSDPVKTSIRIGLLYDEKIDKKEFEEELIPFFNVKKR